MIKVKYTDSLASNIFSYPMTCMDPANVFASAIPLFPFATLSVCTSTLSHKDLEIAEIKRLIRKTKAFPSCALHFNHSSSIVLREAVCTEGFVSLRSNWKLCYQISGQMVKQSVYQVTTTHLTFY